MELNPCEAVLCNDMGTKNVADVAVKYDIERFIMVSTDKAVNPTNIMGASKRIAEIYVQSLALDCQNKGLKTIFVTTRFGNVLGSNGSVIPHFKSQIEKGGPVTVTHPDIIRYFMTIPEACRLMLEAGSFAKTGEIYVFDMGKPVKILDLAHRMIEMAGMVPGRDIDIKFIGLREGEKLYEELLCSEENNLPTTHNKIMVASVKQYDYDEVVKSLDKLIKLAYKPDPMTLVKTMKQIVPEFKSKNSPYEVLD
jgi:FlaA1/EpsC-like NDP-sugar epimerase